MGSNISNKSKENKKYQVFSNSKVISENSVEVDVNRKSKEGKPKFVRRMVVYQHPQYTEEEKQTA